MKKTLLVALSFLAASVSFSTNSGSSTASAPAASKTIENKEGVSSSFNEFSQLPEAPTTQTVISEKLTSTSASEMTKSEKKELKKEIKSEIKSVKKELKSNSDNRGPGYFIVLGLVFLLAAILLGGTLGYVAWLVGVILIVYGLLVFLGII